VSPRVNAPWRWRWGRILVLTAKGTAWWYVIDYAPATGIGFAVWMTMHIRAADTEPLPSPTAPSLPNTLSSYNVEKRYNGAQTTFHPPVALRHEV